MRTKHKSVDNVKIHFRNMERDGMEWIDLAQVRGHSRAVVNTLIKLLVPSDFGNFMNSCTTSDFLMCVRFHVVS
jgi:hypothetical protein